MNIILQDMSQASISRSIARKPRPQKAPADGGFVVVPFKGPSTNSMPPAVLVDLDPDAFFRQPPRCAVGRDIADRAGRAGGAAGARVAALPRSFRMALADPAAIHAPHALHRSHQAQRLRKPGNWPGRTQVYMTARKV
jgi:hypothetical protein